MYNIVLVVHVFLAIGLVATVLLQRSEGNALSGLGGGGPGGGLMTGRGTAGLLTKLTALLMVGFMITSITLAVLSTSGRSAAPPVNLPPLDAPIGTGPSPLSPLAPAAE